MWIFFFLRIKIYLICNQPWKEEAMEQQGKKQCNTVKGELEMETFSVLLGLGRRLFAYMRIWAVEVFILHDFRKSVMATSIQGCTCRTGIHSSLWWDVRRQLLYGVISETCKGNLRYDFWFCLHLWLGQWNTECQPPNCWFSCEWALF